MLKERTLKKSGKLSINLSNVADLEKLWLDKTGRTMIMEIAKKRFATENVLFLSETDNIAILTPVQVEQLVQKYLATGAPFELNLPQRIRDKKSKEDLLNESRKHILHIVFTNFKDEIAAEVDNETSPRPSSEGNLSVGKTSLSKFDFNNDEF
jgi:hypothetical protein